MKILALAGRRCWMMGLLWLWLGTPMEAIAQNDRQAGAGEDQIKAAFLLKFPAYVEWPDGTFGGPDSPLVIGILGADAVAAMLEREGHELVINGRPVRIRRLQTGENLSGVHMLFVGGTTSAGVTVALQAALQRPVLTVSEAAPPRPADSMINFSVNDNKVRFDVALTPAERSGLRFSSRLLQVAQLVIRKTP